MIVDKIEQEGVKAISVKFSGGSGFHVLVPYESFPESINGSSTKRLFPDAPMVISLFLKNELKEKLEIEIKNYGIDNISRELRVDKKEFYQDGKFDPYTIIDIDTVLISERHMFRMQYSLNEKKWFVSVPIHKNKVIDFNIEQAKPDSVDTRLDFFDIHPQKDEAASLFIRAYDAFQAEDKKDTESADVKSFTPVNLPLDITKLPPCIKIMLNGLSDGRKRSIFILVNFLRSIGRTKEEITSFLIDWNAKNKPPLKQNLIVQQVEYAFSGKSYPPPNCDAKGYYKFFNVCFPDQTCRLIKNPLSYYIRLNSKNYKKSK
jgi:Eukaryotic-type DNA primase, large subunit